jgi:hypothetical protein
VSQSYDVIIAGAGPAGIFTALELVKHKKWFENINPGKRAKHTR